MWNKIYEWSLTGLVLSQNHILPSSLTQIASYPFSLTLGEQYFLLTSFQMVSTTNLHPPCACLLIAEAVHVV